MRKMLRRLVYSPLVLVALMVAVVGVKPACSFDFLYQPTPPAE